MIEFERNIHNVLFPESEFIGADQARIFGLDPNKDDAEAQKELIKWRNRKCDILGLWCHIHYKNDIFITGDKNFHKETKKPSLIKLGAKSILLPSELIL
jgi:hypothetical protein